MGMMTQILQSEKKISPKTAAPLKDVEKNQACEICGGENFWESIYLDSVLRCETCEPAPAPDMVGRWVGPAAQLLHQADHQGEAQGEDQPANYEPGTDPADRFVEYVTACGRQGLALRGYDNPKHVNYNQRTCAYVTIGVDAYEQISSELHDEWHKELS